MAANIEKYDVKDICITENMGNVKEELENNGFVDDEILVCKTTINISDDLGNHIKDDTMKHDETYTIIEDIKTELSSEACNDIINGNVKVKEVRTIADIKIEFDNGLFFCENCEAYYEDYCTKCEMLVHILNRNVFTNIENRKTEEMPNCILEIKDSFEQLGIFALKIIPGGVKFGPFHGLSPNENCWSLKGGRFVVNKDSLKYLNWMQYINPARYICEQNLHVFQCEGSIYYRSIREIQAGEELLVYFGVKNEDSFNQDVEINFIPPAEETTEDVFACTFCCLGFRSRIYLTQHKDICPSKSSGKFAVKELTQCPYCKIYLDEKEYLECHMAYCCERNDDRKCIPTIQSKRGRTRRLQMHKCAQCNYRTTFRADLKTHTNNQHYEAKMYCCEICYKRFKTREFRKVHVENTHIDGDRNGIQSCSTNDIKRERRTRHSRGLPTKNIRMKLTRRLPLKENCYECEMCKFKTKWKYSLEHHVKARHLKQFDHKCDLCQYTANTKAKLKKHVKTKHLKLFDYKCDLCQYTANRKNSLELHLKSEHLKQFDYKCDLCQYKVNKKCYLERHVKTKHLNQFDYKCDFCQFKTNWKGMLKRHLKSIHLKQFDYKCDLCQYKTNWKANLEKHVKSKHLKQFDYKCDLCQYQTNLKAHLEGHVKSKHLKKFNYFICDLCEYKAKEKKYLVIHIKSKHLKEFDYKCENCDYKTNVSRAFKNHVNSKHLKVFKYKCEKCEYGCHYLRDFKEHKKSRKHQFK